MRVSSNSTMAVITVEAYNTLLLEFFRAHAERETPSGG